MIDERDRETLARLIEADGETFEQFAKIAGLDPATAFRGADLRGVDFAGSDLAGFDLSEANLEGASFAGASLTGALLPRHMLEVRWPGFGAAHDELGSPTPRLEQLQEQALEAMINALQMRRRAVALLPAGSGVTTVLIETLAWMEPDHRSWSLVIVRGAAARDEIINRLKGRFPGLLVLRLADALASGGPGGIAVHASTAYDFGRGAGLDRLATLGRISSITTTRIDTLSIVLDVAGDAAAYAPIAAAVAPLLEVGRPDQDRQARLIEKLFGHPCFILSTEDAVERGLLVPVPIAFPRKTYDPRESRNGARPPFAALDDAMDFLASPELQRSLPSRSTLLLCRGDDAANVASVLQEHWWNDATIAFSRPRASVGEIMDELQRSSSAVVAGLSRQAVAAAVRSPSVAVLAKLDLATAQEIAYRPRTLRFEASPVIVDLSGSFAGFPKSDGAFTPTP